MSAKTLAWISSALFAVTLLVSVGGFAYLIGQQKQMMEAFRADELLMTSVELSALEAVESGDMRKAHATMIQRIFVGLTRLQPNREQLSTRQRDGVDGVVRRLAASANEIRMTFRVGRRGGLNDWTAGSPLFRPSDA